MSLYASGHISDLNKWCAQWLLVDCGSYYACLKRCELLLAHRLEGYAW